MTKKRTRQPSNAVTNGASAGTVLAPLAIWALHAAGAPLPADPQTAALVGAAVGNLLGHAVTWLSRGGRKGEAE